MDIVHMEIKLDLQLVKLQKFIIQDYVAKRMEIGAVIGAAPKENVVREEPDAGDIIILLGGRTGRDGCGGATGSSKEHTEDSINELWSRSSKRKCTNRKKDSKII